MRLKLDKYLLFTISLFFVLISHAFLTDGMFMDGLWYATLSKNMADGVSSFWIPRLTETRYAWGQPSLAYLLESPFFMVGKTLYMAKIYSVLTCVCTGIIMYLVWREIGGESKNFWIVLLSWVIIPTITWAAPQNLLENTMSIFVLLSILMYLKSTKSRRFLYVLLSGLLLTLSFLTKGLTGLYPLAFPLIYWLFLRKTKLHYSIVDTLLMAFSLLMPILAFYFLNDNAHNFLVKYANEQVLNSIENVQTVDTRFAILLIFFKEILLPLAVVGVIFLIALKQNVLRKSLKKMDIRLALTFMVLALTGVIPMMVSMKQRGFYIITVFPIVALAVGVAMEPLLNNIRTNMFFERFVKTIAVVMLVAAIVLNVSFAGKTGRDVNLLEDVHSISSQIPEGSIIGTSTAITSEWSMMAYFYFYKKISFDSPKEYPYYLCGKNDTPPDSSYMLCVKGNDYQLFKKDSK